ncbi:MAG: AAA family ATPase [Clostridia bacterium]|jgi:hypothetical protein|nr:AAA family ATPase [Clostridia bacterium]
MAIDEYTGKKMIGWIWQMPNSNACLAKPQYMIDKSNEIKRIEDYDFPNRGSIIIHPQGGYSSDYIIENFGKVAFITINGQLECKNTETNWYSGRFNPDLQKPDIKVEKFYSAKLVQCVETNVTYEIIKNEKKINKVRIYTKEIVIKTIDDKYYGPFMFTEKDDYLSLSSSENRGYLIYELNKQIFDEKCISVINGESILEYNFLDSQNIVSENNIIKEYDWISNEKLVEVVKKYISTIGEPYSYTKNQIKNIIATIKDCYNTISDITMTTEREKRIEEILESVKYKDEFLQKIVFYIFDNEDLLNKTCNIICEDYYDKIEGKIPENERVKKEINGKNTQLRELEKQIIEIKEDKSKLLEENRSNNIEEMQRTENSIKELKNELEKYEQNKKSLLEEIKVGNDVKKLLNMKKELEDEIKYLKRDIENSRQSQSECKNALKIIQDSAEQSLSNFNKDSKKIIKMFENKVLKDLIKSAFDEKNEEDNKKYIAIDNVSLKDNSEKIEQVKDFLENSGRIFSYNDVTNFLICIAQGFITTFAGKPGTGKTSLCRLIGKALGLSGDCANNRFVEVSVERGWTSQKDYIGYYNPLTKQLEKSNIQIFDAFKIMNDEANADLNKRVPFIILLDEANLSPIEHYWANFLRLCDWDFGINKSINLGGNYIWKISDGLRFLATVNFDNTTEELSPRFLDRSWIIMLNPVTIDEENISQVNVENSKEIISLDSLKYEFCINENDKLEDNMSNKWDKIKDIYRANNMPISPRNQRMIREYCIVANKYMKNESSGDKFAPLDYAISQKLLPLINGTGENYKKLIEKLLTESKEMPKCRMCLEDISERAKNNFGFYQFFGQ